PVVDRAVKAHLRRVRAIGPLVQLADPLETDDLGPEFVRLLDVADVQHEVVDARRAHRLGRGLRKIGISIIHRGAPRFRSTVWYSRRADRASPRGLAISVDLSCRSPHRMALEA